MSTAFLNTFFHTLPLPEQYIPSLLTYAAQLEAQSEWAALLTRMMEKQYDKYPDDMAKPIIALGERIGCHAYTAEFLFFACAAEPLLARYKAAGISEDIYWDSMRDLLWKFRECLDVHNIPGSFVAHWFPGFFHMKRFALGRLQFEHQTFREESYSRAGVTLHRGDDVINIHIPSAGPLTKESRMDAYRRAYNFYIGEFSGDILPIVCNSWLLYPAHRVFLPAHSNILSFMDDFDIISSAETETFSNAWRVFGADAAKSPADWPQDTSIRRAFRDRILSGGKVGSGYGVILFDGEKIL